MCSVACNVRVTFQMIRTCLFSFVKPGLLSSVVILAAVTVIAALVWTGSLFYGLVFLFLPKHTILIPC